MLRAAHEGLHRLAVLEEAGGREGGRERGRKGGEGEK